MIIICHIVLFGLKVKLLKLSRCFKQGKQNYAKARHFLKNKEIIYAFYVVNYKPIILLLCY